MTYPNIVQVLEHIDINPKYPSGIDNVIIGLTKFSSHIGWNIVGITHDPEIELGKFLDHPRSKNVKFMAVACFSKESKGKRKIIPHSIKYMIGLIKFRNQLGGNNIHAHRLEIGYVSKIIWPQARLTQFIHNPLDSLVSKSSDSHWQYFKYFYKYLEFRIMRIAEHIMVFNEFDYSRLSKKSVKVKRCSTWFDSTIYRRINLDIENSHRLNIAWIGRIEKQKNPLLLLEIANSLRNAKFDYVINIYGSGSLKEKLEIEIKLHKLENYFNFLGVLGAEELAMSLNASDVLLMTSNYEGSPTVLVEAMACGVPVIGTPESDPDHMIVNGVNGFKVKKSEQAELVTAFSNISKLSRDRILETATNRTMQSEIPKIIQACGLNPIQSKY